MYVVMLYLLYTCKYVVYAAHECSLLTILEQISNYYVHICFYEHIYYMPTYMLVILKYTEIGYSY